MFGQTRFKNEEYTQQVLWKWFATDFFVSNQTFRSKLQVPPVVPYKALGNFTKGAFVWDQSGIRIIGIMRVSVCLGAILIPEYLDSHSGYSAPWSRIAGIYSGIYSYSGISQTKRALRLCMGQREVLAVHSFSVLSWNEACIYIVFSVCLGLQALRTKNINCM